MASIQSFKTECDKHRKQLNLYCPSHLKPCCDECISTSHSKCPGIKRLASVVEKTKIEKSKESVEKDINSIIHLLDKIVDYKSTNIETVEQQCEDIKISIGKIRKEINKHLKILEKKLYHEANSILDKEQSKATDLITEIKPKKKLKKNQDNLHVATTHTSKLRSFLGVHQIEQKVQQCQQYVENLEKDDRVKTFDIKMKENHKIKKILSKLGSLESLGEVTFVHSDIEGNRETRRKAQVQSQHSNINNMTMNIETKIEINMGMVVISNMICLNDGRVIVQVYSEFNLFTSDGKLQKQLPISGNAVSVTQINQDTIAITYPDEKAIKIFNMENETVTKVITLDKTCYGLSFSNNCLAVDVSDIDLEGNTLKSIQVKRKSYLKFLDYCLYRVIYNRYYDKAVYCVDESGKLIWQYKRLMRA